MTLLKYTVTVVDDDQVGSNDYQKLVVINLPSGLTIQNRKMHRSCLTYRVNGGYVYDTNQNARIKFGVAPDTWPVKSAIRRARNMWLKMHKELLQNNPTLKPKWHDFKMALSQLQLNGDATTYNVPEDIFDANIPSNSQGITWSVFTSEDSARAPTISGQTNITVSDKDEFTAHLLGDHIGTNLGTAQEQFTSIGALTSWINSRPDIDPIVTISSNEQSTISNDPLNMLLNDGDADNELLTNFTDAYGHVENVNDQEGDSFPMYHLRNPMTTPQEVAAANTTSNAPISYFTGFNAMLGQVLLYIKTSGTGAIDILFDVDPQGATI